MSHEALYRKYRPSTFAELMGQDAINRTLTNAIATRQVAHAYLFCGPRGTGKTTTARLLAKTLNCEAGGTEPCNRCASCLEIVSGSSLDVIEIDAASNRGIDDMRSLREQVRFASVNGRYKVYIIDECHMLTTEAVNALLKTLEEPPDSVVFVMATTEAHKVLPTIVSRCQRFDFQRIPVPVMLTRLTYVAEAEGIPISADSLRAIARRAAGGLRDALTLLDQVASLSIDGLPVSDELVFQVLGEVRAESLLAMGEAMLQGDVVGLWDQAAAYLKAGYDPQTLLRELMQHLRHLLVVQVAPARALDLDVPESLVEALSVQAAAWTQADLLYCLELLNETAERVRRSSHDQIWLEAGLAKVCQRQAIASILDLQARVDELERRAGIAGAERAVPSRPTPRPAASPAPRAAAVVSAPSPAPAVAPTPTPTPVPTAAVAPVEPPLEPSQPPAAEPPRDTVMPPPVAPAAEPPRDMVMPPPVAPAAEPPRDMVMPPPVAPAAEPPRDIVMPPPAVASAPEPPVSGPMADPTPAPAVAPAAASPAAVSPDALPASPAVLWPRFVEAIAERHPPTAAILRSAHLVGVDLAAGTLTIGFKEAILKDQTEKNAKRVALLEGGIKAIFGRPLRLKCVEQAAPPPPEPEPEPVPPADDEPWMDDAAPAAAPVMVEPPPAEPEDPFMAAVVRPAAAPVAPEDPFLAATPAPKPTPKASATPDETSEGPDLVAEAARIFKGKILTP